jgi:FkbH-like protein
MDFPKFGRMSFSELLKHKHAKKDTSNNSESKISIAVTGLGTLDIIKSSLLLSLDICGLPAEISCGSFDGLHMEIRSADSFLLKQKFDLIIVIIDHRIIPPVSANSSRDECRNLIDQIAFDLCTNLKNLAAKTGSQILLTNLPMIDFASPGPRRVSISSSKSNLIRAFNSALHDAIAPDFLVCDVEFLSGRFGSEKTFDEKYWLHAKLSFSPDFAAMISQELAYLVVAQYRPAKKLIVLDLDNTIWGGTIGDDGMAGIELGSAMSRGEGYCRIQSFLKTLKDAGFLLAVCSKNSEQTAKEPFMSHSEMVLKLEDVVSFKANWNPKSANIKSIATELNLLPDSFVFIDDNPIEINEVQSNLPGVTTILASMEPDETLHTLRNHPSLFYNPQTEEDAKRSELYRVEALRSERALKSQSHDEFLKSLDMSGTVEPFKEVNIPRIAQLVNKSNQFNLTTKRRTESDLRNLMTSNEYFGFSIRLSDTFGDHGLIAVVVAKKTDHMTLHIDSWLMSCRVLNRCVEEFTLNALIDLATFTNSNLITGEYIRTDKNDLCKDLYTRLGFKTKSQSQKNCTFELQKESWTKKSISINRTGVPYDQGTGVHQVA